MATRFLAHGALWKRISFLARRTRRAQVAVAFGGADSYKLLPLRRGSTLVVDASPSTVKAGATCPAALHLFVRRGVQVYSVPHLHAKVFVFGRRAIVGSNNVSSASARLLEEAAVETTDPKVVRDANAFFESLDKHLLGPEELRVLQKIYKAPRLAFLGGKPARRERSGIWLVPLVHEEWDAHDVQQARIERPLVRKRLTSKAFALEEFHWVGRRFIDRLARHQRVIQVLKLGRSRTEVYRPASVIGIRRYRKRGWQNAIVFLEIERSKKFITLKALRRRHPGFARIIGRLKQPKLDRTPETRRIIQELWNR